MQPVFMAAIFLLSFGILKPAWDYAIDNSENCTVKISPFCTMNDVFEKDFYDMEFLMRIVTPPIGKINKIAYIHSIFKAFPCWFSPLFSYFTIKLDKNGTLNGQTITKTPFGASILF